MFTGPGPGGVSLLSGGLTSVSPGTLHVFPRSQQLKPLFPQHVCIGLGVLRRGVLGEPRACTRGFSVALLNAETWMTVGPPGPCWGRRARVRLGASTCPWTTAPGAASAWFCFVGDGGARGASSSPRCLQAPGPAVGQRHSPVELCVPRDTLCA